MNPPRWKGAAIVSLCASYAIFCLLSRPPGPITSPDSAGYLGFAPIHTLGYPLFLETVGARGAVVAQPLIYAMALASLGLETLRLTSSLPLAAAVVLASMAVPELNAFHASILTESLFMSGLIAFLATMIRLVRAPSWKTIAMASGLVALAAIFRRTGLAFIPVLLIMTAMEWRRLPANRTAAMAALVFPLLAVLGVERLAAHARHGDEVTSIMGRHLFAKASLMDAPASADPGADPLRARLRHHLAVDAAPVRQFIERAPADTRGPLTLYYERCFQGPCVKELGWDYPWAGRQLNDVLEELGRERILAAPVNFARLTYRDFASLWAVAGQRHPRTARGLNEFVAAHRPVPFEHEAFKIDPKDPLEFQPLAAVRFMQPVVIGIGFLTGALALAGVIAALAGRPLPPVLAVACLAALTAHAGLLFTALFAAGNGRFLISMWPAVATASLFAAAAPFLKIAR